MKEAVRNDKVCTKSKVSVKEMKQLHELYNYEDLLRIGDTRLLLTVHRKTGGVYVGKERMSELSCTLRKAVFSQERKHIYPGKTEGQPSTLGRDKVNTLKC